MGVIIGGITWLILCALPASFAERKGHNGLGYFLLSVILSPLIGLIIVLCISDKTKKQCPYCKKAIDLNATVCGYCGKELKKKKSSNSEKERWISERIIELISTGKSATDAKIQAEAEYSVNKSKETLDKEEIVTSAEDLSEIDNNSWFCEECGSENPNTSEKCEKCGAKKTKIML